MSNLAGTFKSTFKTVSNTSGLTDVVVGATQSSYLLECDIANTGDTGVQVSVKIHRPAAGSTPASSAYLVKKAPVPQGSTLQLIDGQKVVLQPSDKLQVVCETEGQSVDVVVSHVDHVNLD